MRRALISVWTGMEISISNYAFDGKPSKAFTKQFRVFFDGVMIECVCRLGLSASMLELVLMLCGAAGLVSAL